LIQEEFEITYPLGLVELPFSAPGDENGRLDLAVATPNGLKIGEIKPGNSWGYVRGEADMLWYRDAVRARYPGRSVEPLTIKVGPQITVFPNPRSRECPQQDLYVYPATPTGVYGYYCSPTFSELKRTGKCGCDEDETILCGAVSDHGALNKFLNMALDGAEDTVNRFINSMDTLLTKKTQTLSIREGLILLAKHAPGALRSIARSLAAFLVPSPVIDMLPLEDLASMAASVIEKILGPQAEAALRSIIIQIKTKLFTEVRHYIKDRLRTYLQASLNALCAAAAAGAAVSVAQLIRKLASDLSKIFGEVVIDIVHDWAVAAAKEFAKSFAIALLAAIAVVAVIVFLPEIAAALGGAATALGPMLLPMLEELGQLVVSAAPAL
jgi:hypothetical protein